MYAVIVSHNLKTGETNWSRFEGRDCIDRAWAMKAAIEDDFPGCIWGVLADEAAKVARGDDLCKALGL